MSARHDKVRELADRFDIETEGVERTTSDEDIRELLEQETIDQWVAVTTGSEGGVYYIYDEPTREEAQHKAVSNVNDPTFPESPVVVVDLDTGTEYSPDWSSLTWSEDE